MAQVILAALMVLALVATGAAALAAVPEIATGLAAIGGPSKSLSPVTKRSGCRVRVPLSSLSGFSVPVTVAA